MRKGWICPKCHRFNGPEINKCPCSKGERCPKGGSHVFVKNTKTLDSGEICTKCGARRSTTGKRNVRIF